MILEKKKSTHHFPTGVARKFRTPSMFHEEKLQIITLSTVYCNRTILLCKDIVKKRDWHLFLRKIKTLSYLTEILAQINKPRQGQSLTGLISIRVAASKIQRLLHFVNHFNHYRHKQVQYKKNYSTICTLTQQEILDPLEKHSQLF